MPGRRQKQFQFQQLSDNQESPNFEGSLTILKKEINLTKKRIHLTKKEITHEKQR